MAGAVPISPIPRASSEPAPGAIHDATRALLWITGPTDAAAIARDLVERLGGWITAAEEGDAHAIPVDISFGAGAPALPAAPPGSDARALLERHLPAFVGDALRALELADRTTRLAEDAAVDPLTGLPNRRTIGRVLGRVRPGDVVIMIDLDHFKVVNDSLGHHEGDLVLRALGRTLAQTLRGTDAAGRYGGEEFVVVLSGPEPEAFLTRLRGAWMVSRPHPVTFSAGIARARFQPQMALRAADRAMYRAKEAGRDRWSVATAADYA